MGKETRPLEICMVASEALPYAKSGGLADVAGSLSRFLAGRDCQVHLFHPFYRQTRNNLPSPTRRVAAFELFLEKRGVPVEIHEHRPVDGLAVYLVREDSSFDREGLYGDGEQDYSDNSRRFALFCRAVLETLGRLHIVPHVFHLHDWQTALIPLYLRTRKEFSAVLARTPSLLTIHNLAYQGIFPAADLSVTGIADELFHAEGVEFYGKINVLKAGILFADAVSTVSRTYSREIQTPEFGAGLHGLLRREREKIHGIPNGVDYDAWNPATDPFLPANFSRRDLAGKEICKRSLLEDFGLPPDTAPPLMATISRLVDQKGLDIIVPALPSLFDLGYRYVILGTGDAKYRDLLSDVAARYPRHCAVRFAYDEELSHRIEAGADFFLMPSRFEPCGMNQIFSMRYGTIPVVRATGGLEDTVEHYRPDLGIGNGLKFEEYSPEALVSKVHEALLIYRNPGHMRKLVLNAMSADFSWDSSAAQYVALYRSIIRKRLWQAP